MKRVFITLLLAMLIVVTRAHAGTPAKETCRGIDQRDKVQSVVVDVRSEF